MKLSNKLAKGLKPGDYVIDKPFGAAAPCILYVEKVHTFNDRKIVTVRFSPDTTILYTFADYINVVDDFECDSTIIRVKHGKV